MVASANAWSPNNKTVTQANANGLLKHEFQVARGGQRSFDISSFAYAVGTGSLIVFIDGKAQARNKDFVEVSSTSFILSEGTAEGASVLIMGFVGITASAVVDATLRSDLQANSGSNLVGFLRGEAGSVSRTASAKFKDTINVKDYGAVGNGVADDTAAIQAALNAINTYARTIYFPEGNYRITTTIKTTFKGTILQGASKFGTYITTPDTTTFDMLRLAHQMCKVSGVCFKPSTATQKAIVCYAGRLTITDNYFLAPVNKSGTAILLTDIDPDTSAFVSGAYAHTISENFIGDSGFAFAYGITESSTQGIQACHFNDNRILSDRPIKITKGGGNKYMFNLLQSATSGPTGVGISLGATASGEKIVGNYFERFQAMIETLNSDNTYQLFYAVGNHNDTNTAVVADAGAKNYVVEDSTGKVENRNGWSTQYTSATLWQLKTPSNANGISVSGTGNVSLGAASGPSHVINRNTSTENDVLLNLQYNTSSMGYIQDARGIGINGGNTALAINKNSVTNRSINAAGTVNASGADYAEYMYKAEHCGDLAKGQIVGINADGKLTDKWAGSVAFLVKSTDPSYVGGDVWAKSIGSRPMEGSELNAAELLEYKAKLAKWEADLEALRNTVDRMAFAGQVPVNVLEAIAGQYIVAVQDGAGIKGIAVNEADITLAQYVRAVGKVIAIEADGRARIIVKPI